MPPMSSGWWTKSRLQQPEPGAEGTAGANVEGKIQSGPNGNGSIRHCNPQTGRVSPLL